MQQELLKSSEMNVTLYLKTHLEFVRGRSEDTIEPVVHTADWLVNVEPNSKLSTDLQNAIKTPGSQFDVERALPYYITVQNEGKIKETDSLLDTLFASNETINTNATFSTLSFSLNQINPVVHLNLNFMLICLG
jgi:hypothetical protein